MGGSNNRTFWCREGWGDEMVFVGFFVVVIVGTEGHVMVRLFFCLFLFF